MLDDAPEGLTVDDLRAILAQAVDPDVSYRIDAEGWNRDRRRR